MADFTAADLDRALDALDLKRGDVLFGHSNIGYFGRPEGVRSGEAAAELFHDRIRARIGEEGTLVVPTFTYSFPRREVYDPAATPLRMGLFAEWIRRRPDALRSADPSYSVAAVGARAAELDRKSTRLNSSHIPLSRMPSSA